LLKFQVAFAFPHCIIVTHGNESDLITSSGTALLHRNNTMF